MVFFGIHFSINSKARKDRIVPNYFSVYKFYFVPTNGANCQLLALSVNYGRCEGSLSLPISRKLKRVGGY